MRRLLGIVVAAAAGFLAACGEQGTRNTLLPQAPSSTATVKTTLEASASQSAGVPGDAFAGCLRDPATASCFSAGLPTGAPPTGSKGDAFAQCLLGSGGGACFGARQLKPFDVAGASLTAPGAPRSLVALASGSAVTLTWAAPATGDPVTSYVIEAGSSSGLSNLAAFSTGNSATTFSTSGVGAGTYFVRVRGANAAGTSAPSNEALLVVTSGPCAAPGASALTLVANSGGTVGFAWTVAGNATSYVLEAGSAPGLSNLANSDLGNATTFTATGVGAGTYYVRMRSRNACGTSAPSNEITVIVRTAPATTALIRWITDSSTCRCTFGTIRLTINGAQVGTMSCTGSAQFPVVPGSHTLSACDTVSCWPGSSSVTIGPNTILERTLKCS